MRGKVTDSRRWNQRCKPSHSPWQGTPRGDRSSYRRARRPDGAAIPDQSSGGRVPEADQRSRRCDPSSSPLPLYPAPW